MTSRGMGLTSVGTAHATNHSAPVTPNAVRKFSLIDRDLLPPWRAGDESNHSMVVMPLQTSIAWKASRKDTPAHTATLAMNVIPIQKSVGVVYVIWSSATPRNRRECGLNVTQAT